MKTADSMRCFASLLLSLCLLGSAWAHKASDSYLQLEAGRAGTTLRVDIALRDLDAALDLDADGDGRLTWGEVRAAWPAIDRYLLARVKVEGCDFTIGTRGLETRADGAYAALTMASPCTLKAEPAIRYAVMDDVDPTHRGIARIDVEGRPPQVRILTPQAEAAPESPGAAAFLAEGVRHILTGYDHVLFLLCLLLPAVLRRTPAGWRPVDRLGEAVMPVVGIVTAFTVAHSITLGLAASGRVSLSPAFIEPAIAVTIALAAIDNLWPIFRGRRALVTFTFGLIHGFGFAGALAELNLPTRQFAWALLNFNLGLEAGQLVIVAVAVGGFFLVRSWRSYANVVLRGGSIAAMSMAAIWFVQRV